MIITFNKSEERAHVFSLDDRNEDFFHAEGLAYDFLLLLDKKIDQTMIFSQLLNLYEADEKNLEFELNNMITELKSHHILL